MNAQYTLGRSRGNSEGSNEADTVGNNARTISDFDYDTGYNKFDIRHNFVASYNYTLPFERLLGRNNQLTTGWSVAGTTRLSSGFPVTLYNPTDTSLLGTFGNGVNNNLVDTPNYTPGCDLQINHDPTKGPAFNAGCFSLPALGQLGNAPRRFFYGPGIENFDFALIKRVAFDKTRNLEVRIEAFNVFNRPQFYGAGAVDGNIVSPTFGEIEAAAAPRFIQLAAKFTF